MFAEMLSKVNKSTVQTDKYGFHSDFDEDAECHWDAGNQPLQCCWNGESPFKLYAPEYRTGF